MLKYKFLPPLLQIAIGQPFGDQLSIFSTLRFAQGFNVEGLTDVGADKLSKLKKTLKLTKLRLLTAFNPTT